MNLPPAPELDISHLERTTLETDAGAVETFRPVKEPYRCANSKAPALVLVPGMGMDCAGFLRQLPLGAIAQLHLFENRTIPVSGEEGLGGFARYIEAFITAAKLDQHPGGVIIGGASMGGAVSLALAIRGKVKLRGLMMIGSFGSTRRMWFWRRWCMAMIPLSSPWLARKLAGPLLRNGILFGRFSRSEAELLIPAERFDYRYYCCAMRMLSKMKQIEAARQLKIPTLVIHGTHDIVLPIECGQELAEAIPSARFVSVAGGNHMFFLSHHEMANAAMADFIQNL